MVKSSASVGGGVGGSDSMGSVAPFLRKCYDMVGDESTDRIISWNETGDCFVIWDLTQFTVRLLPMYFKHQNFSSFMRQLNIYGFRKIDTDSWVFAHDDFVRGKKDLLKKISRRKHSQPPEQKENGPDELPDKEASELWKAVETLKIDKNTLSQELVKLRQHHESSEIKLVGLRERLQGMETSQQQMLSFLVLAMKYPCYFFKVLQPKEKNWRVAKAGKVFEEDPEDEKSAAPEGGMIVRYQSPANEASVPAFTPVLAPGKPPESDARMNEMDDIFKDSEFMKFLADDKIFPLENPSHFGLPDWTYEGSWEQLLLSNPFQESIEGTKVDEEETANSEMDFELAALGTTLGKPPNFSTA